MSSPVADKNMPRRRHALARADSYEVEETPWGRLVWMVAGRFGNSETMTVGRCDIKRGYGQPATLPSKLRRSAPCPSR
jgi:hypothetical protein